MLRTDQIEAAKEKFGQLLVEQLERVEDMKAQGDFIDYKALDQIIIYVVVMVLVLLLLHKLREYWSIYYRMI